MRFDVKLDRGHLETTFDDFLEESDVIEMLKFDVADIHNKYLRHAADQAFWEELANQLKENLENFKQVDYKKWWAHARQYSRWALLALGSKTPTIDDIKDLAVIIYGKDTSEFQRKKYANFSYQGASSKKGLLVEDTQEEFNLEMFKILEGPDSLFFEDVERKLVYLERQYNTVRNIADRLHARAFHMREVAELLRLKSSNTELSFKDSEVGFNKKEQDLMRKMSVRGGN